MKVKQLKVMLNNVKDKDLEYSYIMNKNGNLLIEYDEYINGESIKDFLKELSNFEDHLTVKINHDYEYENLSNIRLNLFGNVELV